MRTPLTDLEVIDLLETGVLNDWQLKEGVLYKKYHFIDFVQAWAFMSACALVAERMNHHPNWNNVYNVVEVSLSTHDAKAITQLDVSLAKKMDALAK